MQNTLDQQVPYIHYVDALRHPEDGLQNAFLVSEEGTRVRVPLVILMASSPLVRRAAEGHCRCLDVYISLPEFSSQILMLLVDFISGENIATTFADIMCLAQLCDVLGIEVDVHSLEIAEQVVSNDDSTDIDDALIPELVYDNCGKNMKREEPKEAQLSDTYDLLEERSVSGSCVTALQDNGTTETYESASVKSNEYSTSQQQFHCTGDVSMEIVLPSESLEYCVVEEKSVGIVNVLQQYDVGKKTGGLFLCKICQKTFSQRQYLKRHFLIHDGVKNFMCSVCDKKFLHNYEVVKHMMTHTGERPYKCDDCGKCFRRAYRLKTHMLIHEGIKPHVCGTCGTCFRHTEALGRHILVHLGLKPYNCDQCGLCFRRMSMLNKHKRIHQ